MTRRQLLQTALAPAASTLVTGQQTDLPVGSPPQGKAQRWRALLFGTGDYSVAPLRNPLHDVADIAAKLQPLGFEASVLRNATRMEMQARVRAFANSLSAGDHALFYFAGHGVRVDSENYLLPVDFRATDDAGTRAAGVPFSGIQSALEQSRAALAVFVLDACRNNPFNADRRPGLTAFEAGLGSLVVFAASPGQAAAENAHERNGLFTKYLLAGLDREAHLVEVFRWVRLQVFEASNGRQLPYVHDGLIQDVYLRRRSSTALAAGTQELLDRGRATYHSGNCAEAAQLFDQAARQDPENAHAHHAAGMALTCQSLHTGAMERFNRAIQLRPTFAAAYLSRGQLYMRLGNYQTALQDFTWATNIEPENAAAWLSVGKMRFQVREFEAAIRAYDKAVSLNNADPAPLVNRALAYKRLGVHTKALADLDKALGLQPESKDLLLERASVKKELGDRGGWEADLRAAEKSTR